VFIVKFHVIVVVYVASSLANTDEYYIIYYAYNSVQSVIYLVLVNLVVAFVLLIFMLVYCCVFLCCYCFSVNKDLYRSLTGLAKAPVLSIAHGTC